MIDQNNTLRTLLDNLVIAQSLSKEFRSRATDEARTYLYNTRKAADAKALSMTRDAEHTPSPQSVVVPDPLWMMHVIGPDDIYPTPDHAELARLAEAAGGEAWSLNDWRPEGEILVCGGDGSEYGLFATVNDDLPEVAAFIAAANPATVLALLSEIAALRGEVEEMHELAFTTYPANGVSLTWREMFEEQRSRATQAERQRDELRKALSELRGEMVAARNDIGVEDWISFASEALANQGADQ